MELSLLDCLISMSSYLSEHFFATGYDPGPQGARHELVVPYEAYPTKDGWGCPFPSVT